ncbi:MAG: prolyl oligopeptidase family serine peptidase [Candidatus Obscuribacterales bacterium]|nr:prolyl oligopeptidase family serine peptidase [Candidatus Obscuribacterales bacterium]
MNRLRFSMALAAGIASLGTSLLSSLESAASEQWQVNTEQVDTTQTISEPNSKRHRPFAPRKMLAKMQVHVPSAVKIGNQKVPLFVVLHGGLTNWLFIKLDSQFCKRADKDGFIVAFPQGSLLTWNAGQCCGPAKWKKSDDVASVNALIEDLIGKYQVDPNRVYVVGSSNGAMLAQKIAMENPENIAAFASVAGCLYRSTKEATEPISALLINGESDKVVRFHGGRGGLPIYRFDSTPAEMALQYWIDRNQCQINAQEDRPEYLMKDYCGAADSEVLYYQVKNGRHTWPGGLHAKLAGARGDRLLNATDLICDFCLRHRRKQSP